MYYMAAGSQTYYLYVTIHSIYIVYTDVYNILFVIGI